MDELIINNEYDASQNHKLYFPLNADFYAIHINYSGFVPGAATAFKLKRCVGYLTQTDNFIDIPETNTVIADASGNLIYRNASPERAMFMMIEYTADGNDAAAKFNVQLGRQ